MNEAKLYADNFGAAFFEENGFLHFLKERTDGGWWRREESRGLHFLALDDESDESGDYITDICIRRFNDVEKRASVFGAFLRSLCNNFLLQGKT